MKQTKKVLMSALLASSLICGFSASAEQQCHSTATVNGKTYESDKCNVSIVNGEVTFSDQAPSLPAISAASAPKIPFAGLPASVQNLLKGLF